MTTEVTPPTATTTTITPPNIPPDNVNSSEYQRSYSWKLPMVTINRPKERTKSEYQREFTWKNDPPSTPSPAPSPAPVAPSPIPQELITACNTPEPIKSVTNNNPIDHIGSKLNDLYITNNNTSSSNLVPEPEEYVVDKFSTNNNFSDKWKDGLRNKESRQSTLASGLDPKTKKIVALEANRLSKKSRSYSMYSLHDQLKVSETAKELSNPFGTEYNSEFVNWKEYGTAVREDTMASKKRQTMDHTLKRRGSWSAPAPVNLPAPLKWLEDLNLDLGPRATPREKLQPTITDSQSIRGITTTITAKSRHERQQRPTTSAEFRDYHHYDRPTTSAEIRNYSSRRDYDNDNDNYHNSKHYNNLDYSSLKKDRNHSPLRSSTTLGYYKDTTNVDQYYDNRERNNSSSRRERDYDYYDDHKYDDRKYDDRKYDDRKRESVYDDRKRETVYDDRKREIVYDDRKRENVRDDRKRDSVLYDDRRRGNVVYDRQRDNSFYDYDYRKRDNNNDYVEYDSKYNNRSVQTSDQERYNLGHSRNTSYASSNKGSIHDEPTNLSGAPLNYLDALRHRSSVSSLSSASTPSSPATPNGYDMSDFRWRKNNGLDPRIYKEQNYSPSITSKSSSGSNHKYWQFEDDKDRYYHPSALSPSRNKFYVDEDDDDESIGSYSSKRQSRDYKPLTSSAMRYYSQPSPTHTRSTSPSRDGYESGRKHHQKYSSRPPSRATSVSSHATSIEEESAVLTDLLKEAEMMTLKNLTDQMNTVFSRPKDFNETGPKGVKNSGRATPSVTAAKRSSNIGGQKKSTTTTTKVGVKTSKTTPPPRTSTRTPTTTTRVPTRSSSTKINVTSTTKGTKNSSTPGVPPNKKKGHRPTSSLSSTSSYREAYQDYTRPPPTNFSAAREALNRARMKVEEMLEIVSNGGSLD